MTKEKIREKVNKILSEYEGDDLSDLLMIIKEAIENEQNSSIEARV